MKTLRRFIIVPFAVLAFALAGCGILGGGNGDGNEEENGSNDNGDGGEEAAGEPGTVDSESIVAEATYPIRAYDGATVDIQIHELRARGDLVQLTLSVTPNDPEGSLPDRSNIYNIWGTYGLYPYLVDLENLNRHEVVSDDNQTSMGPDVVDTFLNYDQPNPLTWTFAAPPEDVAAVDVYVDEYPPFTEIPVVRQ